MTTFSTSPPHAIAIGLGADFDQASTGDCQKWTISADRVLSDECSNWQLRKLGLPDTLRYALIRPTCDTADSDGNLGVIRAA